jgi:mRNA interferase MazF
VRRGDVYDVRFDPAEGSEQAGIRPAVIVSRDSTNAAIPLVIVVPFTTRRRGRRIYPTHAAIAAPDGGLTVDSVALGELIRVMSVRRLLRLRGTLSPAAMVKIDRALLVTLDLPGQQLLRPT